MFTPSVHKRRRESRSETETHVDKDGDSNPTWNYQMKFKIDESAALQNRLTLVVKIKTEGMFGDKDLGEVHVPIKELLEGALTGGKPLQFFHEVRDLGQMQKIKDEKDN
ncbi:hypothetical protein LXL04_026172 [Taraxacum kok-saghyz]